VSKWQAFTCFFSFLNLVVEMGWMGHYMTSHHMLHLIFIFHFQPYILILETNFGGKRF
jgi:hypothetical protein